MKKNISYTIKKLVAIITIISTTIFFTSCDAELAAVTMRVQGYEGTVSLISGGKVTTLMENMLLHSGDTITTGQQSHIDLTLDDTKAIGLSENSAADFIKSGKKIEVIVKEGEMYFYTTEKLEDDETFDIRTETLIVGIRGTSGYFVVDDKTQTVTFYLTSGKVHVTGKNPNTGGIRETDVEAGSVISPILFNDKEGKDSVVFYLDDFKAEDLPLPMLELITSDDELLEKVSEECGIPKDDFIDAKNNFSPEKDPDSEETEDEKTDDEDNNKQNPPEDNNNGSESPGNNISAPTTAVTTEETGGTTNGNTTISTSAPTTAAGEPDPEETDPEETDPEETDPKETNPEETNPEEIDPEEIVPEETNPEEIDPEEIVPEETGETTAETEETLGPPSENTTIETEAGETGETGETQETLGSPLDHERDPGSDVPGTDNPVTDETEPDDPPSGYPYPEG